MSTNENPTDGARTTMRLPLADWPVIAAGLRTPWHRRAARADLAWYAASGHDLPDKYALASRWGWPTIDVHNFVVMERAGGGR